MALRQPINPFQLLWKKIPKPFRNKYFVAIIVFFFLMIFVDKHDMLTQIRLNKSVKRLEFDKAYYKQKIKEAQQDQQNIQNNKEQFAREKYHMHKADEEVFIIEEQ
jgi:hypothetical protein